MSLLTGTIYSTDFGCDWLSVENSFVILLYAHETLTYLSLVLYFI